MGTTDSFDFGVFWQKAARPIALVGGLSALLAKLYDDGLVIVSISSFLVSVAWLLYVFNRKSKSLIVGGKESSHYTTKTKIWALFLTLTCGAVLTVVLIPARPLMDHAFVVFNERGELDLELKPEIVFSLTSRDFPLSNSIVASGKMVVLDMNGPRTDPIVVEAGKNVDFNARFVAPELYRAFLDKGIKVKYSITTVKDTLNLKSDEMPFDSVYSELIGLAR